MLELVLECRHRLRQFVISPQIKPPKKAILKPQRYAIIKIGIIANEMEPPVGSLIDNGKMSIIKAKAARIADSIIACKLVLRMLSPPKSKLHKKE